MWCKYSCQWCVAVCSSAHKEHSNQRYYQGRKMLLQKKIWIEHNYRACILSTTNPFYILSKSFHYVFFLYESAMVVSRTSLPLLTCLDDRGPIPLLVEVKLGHDRVTRAPTQVFIAWNGAIEHQCLTLSDEVNGGCI